MLEQGREPVREKDIDINGAETRYAFKRYNQDRLFLLVTEWHSALPHLAATIADPARTHSHPHTQELAGQLAEHIVGILHTRDGSLAAMHVLWNTPAKERKAIIKTFKTHVAKIAKEEYGHHVLLSLFDQIDDTVLVKKSIVNVWGSVSWHCHPWFRSRLMALMPPWPLWSMRCDSVTGVVVIACRLDSSFLEHRMV